MENKIFVVDFDFTIAISNYPEIISEIPCAIEVLKLLQLQGDIVILSTCRENEYLDMAIQWLNERNFYPDCINDNYPLGKYYHYGNCRKISGDVIIDDKCDGYVVDWLSIKNKYVTNKNETN